MSSDTAAALQKFLESGHKNTKEIPEHLLQFILQHNTPSQHTSALLSETNSNTSPCFHQLKRSRHYLGQPADDSRYPLEWYNIRSFRTAIQKFEKSLRTPAESLVLSDNDPFERAHEKPGPVYVNADEYKTEQIIDVKGTGKAKQYLVRWKGYSKEDDSWLKIADL
ncbi:hypothetical protein BDV10DRAFT_180070 [Aspergillus recurvatus]